MSTDNNRAAFEALYLAGSKNRLPVERMQDDGYRFMPAQKAWEAWQASRKQAIEEAMLICVTVIGNLDGVRLPKNATGAYECYDKIKELLK